ncbi:uncharacterized protein LOC135700633 [Ochlerotatus camptorhynchus]|uniref:uncharacterized protein LOC135700633 n=1 Tax=Ochlerotatus camptorhynchus TaxID=644619 RepID=UPI0031D0CDC7
MDTIRVNIDIVDLFEFAKESRRHWIEGNELYKNNHVIIVGVTKIDGPHIHIFCSCLRGSNPSDPPREVNITTSQLFQNWSMHCSCPAGNFRCKHQFACLLFIHNKKDLDALSPTDVRQRWGKIAKNQAENLYEPIPLSKLCGQRKKSSSVSLTDELTDELLNVFVTGLPNSALAKSIRGRNIHVPSNQKPKPMSTNEQPNYTVSPPYSNIAV